MTDSIALGEPTVGDEELAAVAEVFRSGWSAGQGPTNQVFEEEFAAAPGAGHMVAVSNCTAALHLAPHAVLFTGATPVFTDVRIL